jgi:hypothetical protein
MYPPRGIDVSYIVNRLHGKEGTVIRITQKMEKEREASYRKMKRSLEERHTQSHRNLLCYILMITDVFLNQKRVNVCEHMVKMAPRESF